MSFTLKIQTYSSMQNLINSVVASGSLPFAKREVKEFRAYSNVPLDEADQDFLRKIDQACIPEQIVEAATAWESKRYLATTGL